MSTLCGHDALFGEVQWLVRALVKEQEGGVHVLLGRLPNGLDLSCRLCRLKFGEFQREPPLFQMSARGIGYAVLLEVMRRLSR